MVPGIRRKRVYDALREQHNFSPLPPFYQVLQLLSAIQNEIRKFAFFNFIEAFKKRFIQSVFLDYYSSSKSNF